MDPAEFASKTNAYLTEYIKIADTKAAAVVTFSAIIGGVLSATSERILVAARAAATWAFGAGAVIAIAVGVATIMGLWYAARALSPQTPNANRSVHSFPDIAAMEPQAFADEVAMLTPGDIARTYSMHNHALATIAAAKFKSVTCAIKALQIALVAAFFLGLVFVVASLARVSKKADSTKGARPTSSVSAP